jgi:hypothetical protein
MSLNHISVESLERLAPAIFKDWKQATYPVFLAICLRDRVKAGDNTGVLYATTTVMVREWLADYLEKRHEAVALSTDCDLLILCLTGDVVNKATSL